MRGAPLSQQLRAMNDARHNPMMKKKQQQEAADQQSRLSIEYRAVDDLIEYARNSRTHSEEQIAQIVRSIKRYGWTNPVLIDEQGTIIAGHGRVMAARRLEIEEVPTITLRGLNEQQRREYVIADNRIPLNAGWNEAMLSQEIRELAEQAGADLMALGFSSKELNKLCADEGQLDASTTHVVGGDRHLLMIEFATEKEAQTAFDELQARGFAVSVMS